MERELIVLALGYGPSESDGPDLLKNITGQLMVHLSRAEREIVNVAVELCQKYASILAWARREKLDHPSATYRALSDSVEQTLLQQIALAENLDDKHVNNIYSTLWELDSFVDLVNQFLVDQNDVPGLITHIQYTTFFDRTGFDTFSRHFIACASLFEKWLDLQKRLVVGWICYAHLPTYPDDFWIRRHKSGGDTTALSDLIWNEYCVSEDQLPSTLISLSIASKLLFVGVSVMILSMAGVAIEGKITELQNSVCEMFGSTNRDHSPLVESFDLSVRNALEVTVNAMHEWAENALYDLITKKNRIETYFDIVYQYFLLQDGFFYGTFFSQNPSNFRHDVDAAFQMAIASNRENEGPEKAKLLKLLRLKCECSLEGDSKSPRSKLDNPHCRMDRLYLEYDVPWPVNLLISSSVLNRYNLIFNFAFTLRRIQTTLQRQWKKIKMLERARHQINLWIRKFSCLRHQMDFVVGTLAQYVHIDVFSTGITALNQEINRSSNYDDLVKAQESFISQTIFQCFLDVPALLKVFGMTFDTIEAYCNFLESLAAKDLNEAAKVLLMSEDQEIEFTRITKSWRREASLLLRFFSKMKIQAPHFSRLTSMFEYNLFFESEAPFGQGE
ncbi:gamma-tubulin complex component 4-like [Schistocerca gregaria]|uniref:gamma-tubulin complex component 4-like n=1 Tax=Schistocerca gregaria TaxID=7010 RepID=UPI00211F2480|nr:gamma-tubulin complex component 4-like [Schistocerca gregaria]